MNKFAVAIAFNAVDRMTAPVRRIKQAVGSYRKDLDKLKSRMGTLSHQQQLVNSFRRIKTETSATRNKLAEKQRQIANLAKEIKSAASPGEKLTGAFRENRAEAGRLKRMLRAQEIRLEGVRRKMTAAGISSKNLASATQKITKETKELNAALDAKAKRLAKGGKGADGGLLDKAAAPITLGLALAKLQAPITQRLEMEHRVAAFQTVAGVSDAEIAKIKNQIAGLTGPAITNQKFGDLFTGLEVLTQKGLDVSRTLESLPAIGRTATATQADIEDLSKTVFSLLDNLKVDPKMGLDKALNALASAGKRGSFELKNMAQYFPKITAQAAALKMEGVGAAARLGAALQIAMKGAGDPSEAANNLVNFLNKATSPETRKRFGEMGVDLEESIKRAQAQGEDTFEHLLQLIQDLTGGDKFRIGELFGDMQVINFLNPMLQNLDEYKKITAEALGAAGVIDKDFATMMRTGKEQLKSLEIQVGMLGASILGHLMPAITAVFAPVSRVLSLVNIGIVRFPLLGSILGGVVAGGLIVLATAAIPAAIAGVKALTAAIMANPIGLALGGIAIVATVIISHWDKVVAVFRRGVTFIKTKLAWTPLGLVLNHWVPIRAFFGKLWAVIKVGAGVAWRWLKTVFRWSPLGLLIRGWIKVFHWLNAFWKRMTTPGSASFQVIQRIFQWSPLGLIIRHWEPVKIAVAQFWRVITGFARVGFAILKFLFRWSPAGLLVRTWLSTLPHLKSIWAAITTIARTGFKVLFFLFKWSPFGLLIRAAIPVVRWFARVFGPVLKFAALIVLFALKKLWDYSPFGQLAKNWGPITKWFSDRWQIIVSSATAAKASLLKIWAKTPLGKIIGQYGSIANWMVALWDRVQNRIQTGITGMIASVNEAIAPYRLLFQTLIGLGKQAGSGLLAALSEPFQKAVKRLEPLLTFFQRILKVIQGFTGQVEQAVEAHFFKPLSEFEGSLNKFLQPLGIDLFGGKGETGRQSESEGSARGVAHRVSPVPVLAAAGGPTVNVGAITVVPGPGMDEEKLAKKVRREISRAISTNRRQEQRDAQTNKHRELYDY